MAIDDDLPEYTGRERGTLAVPKPSHKAPAPSPEPKSWKVTDTPDPAYAPEPEDEPAPRVAVYNPPEPGASHPKHAVLGPALRLDRAEHDLTKANAELIAATAHLRACELAEADAETALMAELPGPTQEETLRAYAESELKARADRVAAGLSPDTRATVQHGPSVLDRIAAHRPRPVPGRIAAPLLSNAARRTL
jgi:hypothetical protein